MHVSVETKKRVSEHKYLCIHADMSTWLVKSLLLVSESETVTAIIFACEAQWRVAITVQTHTVCFLRGGERTCLQ